MEMSDRIWYRKTTAYAVRRLSKALRNVRNQILWTIINRDMWESIKKYNDLFPPRDFE